MNPGEPNQTPTALPAGAGLDGSEQTALVEAIAQRVAELLRPVLAPLVPSSTSVLVDAAELARVLNVSRDTVYEYADELGAIRRDSPRARLRFDVEKAIAAWSARQAGVRSQVPAVLDVAPNRGGRPRSSSGACGDLLPIRDRRAA